MCVQNLRAPQEKGDVAKTLGSSGRGPVLEEGALGQELRPRDKELPCALAVQGLCFPSQGLTLKHKKTEDKREEGPRRELLHFLSIL